ncbi:MAG: sigma-70 family RNA polymerase sigma factor [Blautia sp.]|jgi:RNA polymerase sigma factor (sigma-70 family)
MDGKRPKRRKDKDNPYTLKNSNGRYYIIYRDGQRKEQCVEISHELFQMFDDFELEDLHHLNIVDRHLEQSELYDVTLERRAQQMKESAEEEAIRNITIHELHKAIDVLPDLQKRRLILYYFVGLTYEQIAEAENCSFQAVAKSIASAEEKLKKLLK